MADTEAIYKEIVEGLIDNSKVNHCPYSEGWDADQAISVYYQQDNAVKATYGALTEGEYSAVRRRVARWLQEHAGRSYHDDPETA